MEEDEPNPNPTIDTTTAANRKHQAMLERFSNHHHHHQPRPGSESEPEPESVSSFLSLFSTSKLSVESNLARCRLHHPSDPKPDIDRISASISDLEQTLARNSYFLPSYELRSSLHSISELKQTLETLTNDLIPKKKFSFKNRNKSNPNPNPNPSKKDQAELITVQDSNFVIEGVTNKNSPGFRNRNGEILVKNFTVSGQGDGEFTLAELDSCEVYLKGKIRALFINRIKNCRIFCGPVSGSILIEDVSSCLFMLASHQIRIHEARGTDFYLRVRSRPIVEDCSGVRFSPYMFSYEGVEEELRGSGLGEETGNWVNVDDFKWLRAVQSPNWCVIPDEERVDVVDALDLEEKSGNE